MKITAYTAQKPGLIVQAQELEINDPQSHEISVRITHCSVGRGDVSFLRNDYDIPDLRYPLVAGHELVGIVESLGSDTCSFAIGDRVGIGFQISCCGACEFCLGGHEELCKKQHCLIADHPGGFASHIVVDEHFVFKIPDSLDSAAATPLFCSGLTVHSCILKAHIKENMKVGVVGIGGLGHIAVQLLANKGAQVTAFTNKKDLELVKELGASTVVGYEPSDMEINSFDRIFITTYAHVNYDYYLKLLKPNGELWVVGVDTQPTNFSASLLNDYASRSIRGSYIGSPSEMRKLLEIARRKDITGSVRVLPVDQLNYALTLVAEGCQDFRIVIEMQPSD